MVHGNPQHGNNGYEKYANPDHNEIERTGPPGVFRGAFFPEEEKPEAFRNGIPTFDTIPECMEWASEHAEVGSNPNDPALKHNITHLVNWQQIEEQLIPRIKHLHEKENSANFTHDVPVDLTGNVFNKVEEVQKELDSRLAEPFHSRLSIASTMNTLKYLFFHMRCGIFVAIRENKVKLFVPFVNQDYTNNWGELKLEGHNNMKSYLKEKRTQYREENILPMSKWWANGNIICNEHTRPRTVTQWWGDNMVATYKHMLEAMCNERTVPDVDFFFNKRDYPQLKMDLTEPYDFIFDQIGKPLSRHKYGAYTPILSFYTSGNFADLPSPTTEDWEGASGKVFPPSFIPNPYPKKKHDRGGGLVTFKGPNLDPPRDLYLEENFKKFHVEWNQKVNTAFFRGNATGGGTSPKTNQRLNVAFLSGQWAKRQQGGGDQVRLLDAGVTGWNCRDKKLIGSPMTFVRKKELKKTFDLDTVGFVPMYQQGEYKYIMYIEGHCAANRYAFLMRLGSVILKVESTCEARELWYFPLLLAHNGSMIVEEGLEGADHVSVKSDLSDLEEKILWCRANDGECRKIAANAKLKYEKYVSRGALLDYMQLAMVKVSNHFIKLPDWFKLPNDTQAPISLGMESGRHLYRGCARVGGNDILCARCEMTRQADIANAAAGGGGAGNESIGGRGVEWNNDEQNQRRHDGGNMHQQQYGGNMQQQQYGGNMQQQQYGGNMHQQPYGGNMQHHHGVNGGHRGVSGSGHGRGRDSGGGGFREAGGGGGAGMGRGRGMVLPAWKTNGPDKNQR